MEPKNAEKNPVISKPFRISAPIQKHRAFITRIKNPTVMTVIGNVNKISTGRITMLIKPRNMETIRAVPKLLI